VEELMAGWGLTQFARRNAAAIQATVVGVTAYVSGVIVNLVTQDVTGDSKFWILISGGLVACVILTGIVAALDAQLRRGAAELAREYATHRSGYQTLNREINHYIAQARTFDPAARQLGNIAVQFMQNACRDLYETLETEYGLGVSVSEHIEFEVTFMTRSLADGQITIAAWMNRFGRAPKSLAGRAANPMLYVGTETDHVYQDQNRTPRFVSSTETQPYKELYPGQKSRIKSSVIWPVVDDHSTLHGTLVVHCDRVRFFAKDREKLWREALEPYTKRLALARVIADRAKDLGLPDLF
jgi:hypothetical protein